MNTDIYIVNIDSKFKNPIYTNSADFIYTFLEPLKNIISIKLSSIEFPNLYYTFSSKKKITFLTLFIIIILILYILKTVYIQQIV